MFVPDDLRKRKKPSLYLPTPPTPPTQPPGPGFSMGDGQIWPQPPEPERGYAWRRFIERQREMGANVERIYPGMLEGSEGWGIPPQVWPAPKATPIALQPGAIPIPERFHPPSVGTPGPGPTQGDIQQAMLSIFGATYEDLIGLAESQIARTSPEILKGWREDAESYKRHGYLHEGIDNYIRHEALEVALKNLGIPTEYRHWITQKIYWPGLPGGTQGDVERMTRPTPIPMPLPTPPPPRR